MKEKALCSGSICASFQRPRSAGLMRPSAVTAVASATTAAARPTARLPKCTKCQSWAKPSWQEYWHIGETRMRWASSTLRKRSGSNKWDIRKIEILIAPAKREELPVARIAEIEVNRPMFVGVAEIRLLI